MGEFRQRLRSANQSINVLQHQPQPAQRIKRRKLTGQIMRTESSINLNVLDENIENEHEQDVDEMVADQSTAKERTVNESITNTRMAIFREWERKLREREEIIRRKEAQIERDRQAFVAPQLNCHRINFHRMGVRYELSDYVMSSTSFLCSIQTIGKRLMPGSSLNGCPG